MSVAATWQRIGLISPLRDALTPRVRGIRVLLLCLATLCMALGDLMMTLTYVTSVGMVENNPLARAVMEQGSAALVVVWKMTTIALGLGILTWKRHSRAAEIGAWVVFAAMLALSIHWVNFNHAVASMCPEYSHLAMTGDPRWVVIAE
jgi:hypothetical protein